MYFSANCDMNKAECNPSFAHRPLKSFSQTCQDRIAIEGSSSNTKSTDTFYFLGHKNLFSYFFLQKYATSKKRWIRSQAESLPHKWKVKGKNRDGGISAETFLIQQEFFYIPFPIAKYTKLDTLTNKPFMQLKRKKKQTNKQKKNHINFNQHTST